jgi:transcriptional regulator with XRE-family HTH domain
MENLKENIGDQIEIQRKIKKLTRKELGDKIGVSYQQIRNYETGGQNITVERLAKVSKALDYPITNFFNND